MFEVLSRIIEMHKRLKEILHNVIAKYNGILNDSIIVNYLSSQNYFSRDEIEIIQNGTHTSERLQVKFSF